MNYSFSVSAIVILLAINAFFVAAEFALVKAKSFRIDALAKDGSASAQLTQRILGNLESYLAACQLGITMASLGLGWVGEPVVASLLEPLFTALGMPDALIHTISFLLGFLLFSALHIVIGEQVPKTFAIRKAEPVSMWSSYPLHIFYLVAYPLNWLLNKASGSILAMFNVEEATHADVLSNEEIKGVIETSEKHGDLNTDRAVMLNNMFDFDSHIVQQIMVPRDEVDTIDLQDSWEVTLETIRTSKHSRFPVFDEGSTNPIGTIVVKDVYNDLIAPGAAIDPIESIKNNLRKAVLVPESQPIFTLFDSMRKNRNHMAMVMDEYSSFSGVVTLEDMLEEIVGEIADEFDTDEPESLVTKVDDHWEAGGLVALTDLDRILVAGITQSAKSNTINGLFMEHLNRMPRLNDEIVVNEYRFLVTEIDIQINRIDKVSIFFHQPDSSVSPDVAESIVVENPELDKDS